jgi:xanthine dehydrogenase accessory factor
MIMPLFDMLRAAVAEERPVALATVVAGANIGAKLLIDAEGTAHGSLGTSELDTTVLTDAIALLDAERNESRTYPNGDEPVDVLIETYPAPPHLIIVGAVHTAIPLTTAAKLLGFRVSVIDPRTTFATPERFPDADALITEWPDDALPQLRLDRSTYIVVLTHDPKFDDPAVRIALAHPVRYIGALGSQRTQARRRATLLEAGVDERELGRIFGPVGLSIGARTPAELAISIIAEIVAVRRGQRP